jgi:TRAP-type C4-dicarboxylate transport system permease small subunit
MLGIINKYLYKGIYWLTAGFSILFFAMVCLNVFTRYVLRSPILASIELSRIFFVWACFLAAGITFYKGEHIVISFVADLFPPRIKKIINLTVQFLMMLFLAVLGYWSVEVVIRLWNTKFPILGISQSWLYAPLALISLIMFLFCLEMIGKATKYLKAAINA